MVIGIGTLFVIFLIASLIEGHYAEAHHNSKEEHERRERQRRGL